MKKLGLRLILLLALVLAPLGGVHAHMTLDAGQSVTVDMDHGSSHHHSMPSEFTDDVVVDCCALEPGACTQLAAVWSGGWHVLPFAFQVVNHTIDQVSLVGRSAKVLKQPPRHI